MRRWLQFSAVTALLISAITCGSSTPSTPTSSAPAAPAPAPTPPASTYTVTGLVADLPGSHPVANATVSVTSGPNTNRAASSDVNGQYSLTALVAGAATLRATAPGYDAVEDPIVIPSQTRADFRLPATIPSLPPGSNAQCDASLWPHMHDVQRIKIVTACQTVTGVIAAVSTSDDGDYDMQLTLDAGFGNLLNAGNLSKLNGNLQIEAICQAPVHADVPNALQTCANFVGTVPIPTVGMHVRVTGVYVLDSDHGWMEIHPISVMSRY